MNLTSITLTKLATGDGALGFWKVLPQVYPTTRTQRCWVHKMANVLDKLPKRNQPKAKDLLHEIWMAPSRKDADQAFDAFIEMYEPKYPKAAECLKKDRDVLLSFTTSRRNTGCMCGPRTRLNRCLRRFGCVIAGRRDRGRGRPAWRWCSS